MQKKETKSRDVLYVKGKIEEWEVSIVVVYFSVGDVVRNNGIKLEIEKIAEENTESLIIAGDFNGHVRFKGKQKLDRNGEIILHWMDRFGMVMLNDDEECKGKVIWR